MKKLLLLALLITNFLFANKINTINFEWTGLFPSLNLEYKFENTKFRYNILRFGLGKYNRPKGYQCSDCERPEYIITPSLSIYKEKADNVTWGEDLNVEEFKDERGFIIVLNDETFTIARVITLKYIPKDKNYYFRIGAGYGVLFSFTSNYIPIVLPTFGFGIKF